MTQTPSSASTIVDTAPFRSRLRCAFWCVLLIVTSISAVTRGFAPTSMVFWFLAIYCAQAFAAEYSGLKVDESGMAFPRRILGSLPFFVFWRTRIEWKDVEHIASKPTTTFPNKIEVQVRNRGRWSFNFPTRPKKLAFFHFVKSTRPMIRIYRSQ